MDLNKKLFRKVIILLFTVVLANSCANENKLETKVLTGADVLLSEQFHLIKNKNLGIVTNHTALLSNGIHLVDTLFNRQDTKIKFLFGPEHGIRGDAPDGDIINDGVDQKTGLPVYSLYGKTKKPDTKILDSIDVLIFDIQDIGARFYTFISTMYYTIQSAAENNIPILVLDRPNPINGNDIQGPLLKPEFKSFVGIAEIPIRHGMTIGELALLFNQKEILKTNESAKLEIVKIKNWNRKTYYDECDLNWIKPSPNMPTLNTALVYPGLCLLEGTNVSEGRGTYSPFLKFGSPYIDSDSLVKELNKMNIVGCEIKQTSFTPMSIENMSKYPKYKNEECFGIEIVSINRKQFKPIHFAIKLIHVLKKLYPDNFKFREKWIDKLWGSHEFQKAILENKSPEEIILQYQNEINKFKLNRKPFLLY